MSAFRHPCELTRTYCGITPLGHPGARWAVYADECPEEPLTYLPGPALERMLPVLAQQCDGPVRAVPCPRCYPGDEVVTFTLPHHMHDHG